MVVGLLLSVAVICALKSRKPTFSTWYFEPLRVRKPRRCPRGSEKSQEQGPAGPVLPPHGTAAQECRAQPPCLFLRVTRVHSPLQEASGP